MDTSDRALWNVTRGTTHGPRTLAEARDMTRDEAIVSDEDEWVIWHMPPAGNTGRQLIAGCGPDPIRPIDGERSTADDGPCG